MGEEQRDRQRKEAEEKRLKQVEPGHFQGVQRYPHQKVIKSHRTIGWGKEKTGAQNFWRGTGIFFRNCETCVEVCVANSSSCSSMFIRFSSIFHPCSSHLQHLTIGRSRS